MGDYYSNPQQFLMVSMLYFFDLELNGALTADEQGTECKDFDEMRSLAMRFLAEVANDEPGDASGLFLRTAVRNPTGTTVYEASLRLTGHPL